MEDNDPVNHPSHYTSHPSGVECIDITRHMDFPTGNAMKYLWRAGLKLDKLEDLKKSRWYTDVAIEMEEARLAQVEKDSVKALPAPCRYNCPDCAGCSDDSPEGMGI